MAEIPRFNHLLDMFQQSLVRYGTRRLFGERRGRGPWDWISYRQFGAQVDALRGGLAGLGLTPGEPVAMILRNRVEWAATALAAVGLGCPYVGLYPGARVDEWQHTLADCGARAVVVPDERCRALLEGLRDALPRLRHIICLGGEGETDWGGLLRAGRSQPVPVRQPEEEDLACLIYTSGTTDTPRGVMLSHRNLASNLSAMHRVFRISATDGSLSVLPWAHAFGQTCELFGMISMGASIALCRRHETLLDDLSSVRPTILFSVPELLHRLHGGLLHHIAGRPRPLRMALETALARAESGRSGVLDRAADRLLLSRLRGAFGGRLAYSFVGGAALRADVARTLSAMGIPVYEGYGLTETAPVVSANRPGARRLGSVGRPLPGVRVHIDLAQGQDGVGEIVVYGDNISPGYWGPGGTPERDSHTADGAFRTGDLGYLDEDGFLWITGRLKERYKLANGHYVVPGPLESRIAESPYIRHVLLSGANQPANVAIVSVDTEALGRWGAEQGYTGPLRSWLSSDEVRALYRAEIDRLSGDRAAQAVAGFALTNEPFSVDNGLLTPSLKLRRAAAHERFAHQLDALFGATG